jgi:hypothetical protein
MPESFRSFSKRIKKGLPLVSDEEKEFEKEAKEIQAIQERRNKRRENLLWKSIPLLARNWHLFRKYPKLYNIPIDFVYFGDFFRSISWEPQNHNVPLGGLVAAWKTETCQLACPHCQGKAFLVPQHHPEPLLSFGSDDSTPYYIYCEKCGAIINWYDFDTEISEKRSKFERIMSHWNRRAEPAVPPLQFERAIHLLTLYEASGEEPDEFEHAVHGNRHKAPNPEMPEY